MDKEATTPLPWAVIPNAGRGTRMHPAAAIVPKSLLPVGPWPMLHWALDEALAAEVGGMVLIVGPEQGLIREYVETAVRHGRRSEDSALARLGRGLAGCELRWVVQAEPRGIGDALIRCREITGPDSFGVLIPDNWFHGRPSVIGEVARTHRRTSWCTLALTPVEATEQSLFGNVGGVELERLGEHSFRILRLQDKKQGTFGGDSGGPLRACARYVLGAEFYDALEATGPPRSGEWDDVPAFQLLVSQGRLAGHRVHARHYDVGHPAGFLAAAAWLRDHG